MVHLQPSLHSTEGDLFPPNFLDKTIVLNLDEREDRLIQTSEELKKVGIAFERFPATRHAQGGKGYNQSILRILESYQDIDNLLLIEDDCKFIGDLSHVRAAVKSLPKDFDALWLGSNIQSLHEEKISENLYRLRNGWSTHAIVTSKKFRQWCLDNWDKELVFDEFLRVTAQPTQKCFVVYPMVAIQRASHSDILNGWVNYEPRFLEANTMFI